MALVAYTVEGEGDDIFSYLYRGKTLISSSPKIHAAIENPREAVWCELLGHTVCICKAPAPLDSLGLSVTQRNREQKIIEGNRYFLWGIGIWLLVSEREEEQDYHDGRLQPASCTAATTTLKYVCQKKPRTFQVPKLLFEDEDDEYTWVIYQHPDGEPLPVATVSKVVKFRPYMLPGCATKVADALAEMSEWEEPREAISGVDGKSHPDKLLYPKTEGLRVTPEQCLIYRKSIGLDEQKNVFTLGRLDAWDILVNNDGFVGFRDYDKAGFAPRNWAYSSCTFADKFLDCDANFSEFFPVNKWTYTLRTVLEARGFNRISLRGLEDYGHDLTSTCEDAENFFVHVERQSHKLENWDRVEELEDICAALKRGFKKGKVREKFAPFKEYLDKQPYWRPPRNGW